jgi:D-amino-acid dehydrogenase
MHVAVLGAGVVGVTTAHFLSEAGHKVTVIDRDDDVAAACSYANGAQLSYSYVDAMASPAFLLRMPALLAGFDRAILVRPPVTTDFLRWGLEFVRECSRGSAAANTLANLQLAARSKILLDELRKKLEGDFSFREAGKLVLLRKPRDLETARRVSELKAELGCPANVVSMAEATDIEPAVGHMTGNYAGAVYSAGDEVGDAHAFAKVLAEQLRSKHGCRFEMGMEVDGLIVENNELKGIATAHGLIDADAVVVCLGTWSPAVLAPLGINIPVCPARGYSITLQPGEHTASVSVTDFGRRFVISYINNRVRIAGFADFVGYRTDRDEQRIRQLLDTARVTAPFAADYASSPNHGWGGFRPLTPNGHPITEATAINGVYLNTGHGSLGWTLACGAAERVVELVSGAPESALAA